MTLQRGENVKIESTNIFGTIISGYETDYVFQTINGTSDFYESKILNKWILYINDAKVVFDVGANLGNHTLFLAKKLNAIHAIYSFEPFMLNFEILKKNITDNKLLNVYPINKGVGARNGKITVSEFDESNYGGTTFTENGDSDEYVELITLDAFIRENNIDNLDFVKVDTEGFEIGVLQGMQQAIENFYPDLWIEVSANSFLKVIELLEPSGYVLADVEGFNMLFLHKKRHEDIIPYSTKTMMQKMFEYLEKTNAYYKNYETAKKWLQSKQEVSEKLKTENRTLQEKSKELTTELNIANKKYKDALLSFGKDYGNIIVLLEEINRKMHHLEVQNGYLKSENEQYRKKLSIITDSSWGKLGIKVYKKLKQIKAKFSK